MPQHRAMIECPNCREAMTPQQVEGNGSLIPLEIDACASCNLFWFDRSEGMRLTPKAVIGLFQFIGKAGRARTPLVANFRCPRCVTPLALTHDLQRTTRFTYWRCPNDAGQLITFNQVSFFGHLSGLLIGAAIAWRVFDWVSDNLFINGLIWMLIGFIYSAKTTQSYVDISCIKIPEDQRVGRDMRIVNGQVYYNDRPSSGDRV